EYSTYNVTAWSVSSDFGPLSLDTPQALQLELMLAALGVVPYMNTWTETHAPYLPVKGSYYDWTGVYAMMQVPESVSFCIPMVVTSK
ncbi:hypothetical protein KIPB_012574, partial [Kipferlia bialata]